MSGPFENTYDANYPGKQPAEAEEAERPSVWLDTLRDGSAMDPARRWVAWEEDYVTDEPVYYYGATEREAAGAAKAGLGATLVGWLDTNGITHNL